MRLTPSRSRSAAFFVVVDDPAAATFRFFGGGSFSLFAEVRRSRSRSRSLSRSRPRFVAAELDEEAPVFFFTPAEAELLDDAFFRVDAFLSELFAFCKSFATSFFPLCMASVCPSSAAAVSSTDMFTADALAGSVVDFFAALELEAAG